LIDFCIFSRVQVYIKKLVKVATLLYVFNSQVRVFMLK